MTLPRGCDTGEAVGRPRHSSSARRRYNGETWMPKIWCIILLHQFIFQGVFVAKNVVLRRKLGIPIRGHNREATIAIAVIVSFIGVAVALSILDRPPGELHLLSDTLAGTLGLALLLVGLVVAGASLVGLRDSWRVGVLEEQQTELITTGIYRFTRNPYFVSYLLMFAAYTILLQNAILLGLSLVGFWCIHRMIVKEEAYLSAVHGEAYRRYRRKVPRYILV